MMRKSWIHNFVKPLGVVLALIVLTLAGCGGGGSGSKTVTVGSKHDADGQLLGEMYILLLQKAGYTVTNKLDSGDTTGLDAAIKSGAVDIYPEFTGTAVTTYKLKPDQDAHTSYQTVKDYYESSLKLTWLDAAFGLNDSYGICTSQANATKYNLKSNADLAAQASNLVVASQADGITAAVNPVQTAYGFTFKSVTKLQEQDSYAAVLKGDVQLMVCYTSDPAIVSNNFVLLTDPKGVFPNYNPAPVVRDSVLSAHPDIKDVLNPLAAKLTTTDQVALIKQVHDGKTVQEVAKAYLQSKGLL